MKEVPCLFGSHQHLAGIVTDPQLSEPPKKCVLLVSAGLLPMSGPFRFYTNLARRLAQEGILTLRFDLGGIGESKSMQGSLPLRDRTKQDISSAIEHLLAQFPSIENITIGGLCSGAEDAFRAAYNDSRIGGVLLIDPFAYRTYGWAWRHLLYRFARRFMRTLGLYTPLPLRTSCAALDGQQIVTYNYMSREESSQILENLLGRNINIHFIYTGGMREYFNHKRQLTKMFPHLPFRGLVKLDLFLYLNHTQMLEQEQSIVVGAIVAGQRAGDVRVHQVG